MGVNFSIHRAGQTVRCLHPAIDDLNVHPASVPPFDRVIAGNAIADGAALLTADRVLRRHLSASLWPE